MVKLNRALDKREREREREREYLMIIRDIGFLLLNETIYIVYCDPSSELSCLDGSDEGS